MEKITPFLWFNDNAEEAMNFYIKTFKNSKIISVKKTNGKVFSLTFELDGQKFHAINGGPMFKFTEAISLFVNCEDQKEVDYFWEKLSKDGSKGQCGWLKDKYGISWQIIPKDLWILLNDKDPEKSKRVMDSMLKMTKIEINLLKQAYDNNIR